VINPRGMTPDRVAALIAAKIPIGIGEWLEVGLRTRILEGDFDIPPLPGMSPLRSLMLAA